MANDVNLSMIYLGNYPEIDTNEGNLAAENEASLLGTYGSAGDPLYNYVTVVDSDSPTQFIDTDQDTGNGTLTYDVGAGTVTTKLDSFVTYNGTVTYGDGSSENIIVDVLQFTNGDVFIPAWDNYPQFATKGIESVTLNSVDFDRWGGFEQASYDSVQFVCFAPGTLIATPRGEVPVEILRVGDEVCTLDHGAQALVWIGRRKLRFPPSPARQKPMEFKPGSLGPGMPRRRLVISPQHRVLMADASGGVLAPACAFAHQRGVRRMAGCKRIEYIALMCAAHEVLFAEGAPVESFYPGRAGLALLSPYERLSLLVRVPQAGHGSGRHYGPMARPALPVRAVRDVLAARGGTRLATMRP